MGRTCIRRGHADHIFYPKKYRVTPKHWEKSHKFYRLNVTSRTHIEHSIHHHDIVKR